MSIIHHLTRAQRLLRIDGNITRPINPNKKVPITNSKSPASSTRETTKAHDDSGSRANSSTKQTNSKGSSNSRSGASSTADRTSFTFVPRAPRLLRTRAQSAFDGSSPMNKYVIRKSIPTSEEDSSAFKDLKVTSEHPTISLPADNQSDDGTLSTEYYNKVRAIRKAASLHQH